MGTLQPRVPRWHSNWFAGHNKGRAAVGNELLQSTAKASTLCAYCPKMCRFSCSVAETEGKESTTPWGKMSLVYLAHRGEVSLNTTEEHRVLEACTGCGACVEQCAHGNPVAEALFTARGVSQTARAKRFREAFLRTGDVKERNFDDVIAAFDSAESSAIAYFPGCTRLAQGPEKIANDLEALAIATGQKVKLTALPSDIRCCGYPLYADGQEDVLQAHLPKLSDALAGHRVVVTPDPGCAYMMSVVHDALAPASTQRPSRVVPLVEVLGERAERFAGRSAGLRVRYHDPCYLGRRGRSFDAPRRLLQAALGTSALEFALNRDHADCSGSGGLYPCSSPEGAKQVASRRVHSDPNAHIEVDAVVSACPSACKGFARAGVKSLDIVDVALGKVK